MQAGGCFRLRHGFEASFLPAGLSGMEIQGVVRGMGLRYRGDDITGEGMGVGGVVVRLRGVTHFPMKSEDIYGDGMAARRFFLNGLSRRFLGPIDVTRAHRYVREKLSPKYVEGSSSSLLFEKLIRLRTKLLKTRYMVSETAEVCGVRYRFSENSIQVDVARERGRGTLVVANEVSGELFDTLLVDGHAIRMKPWTRLHTESPALYSTKLGVKLALCFDGQLELYAGREVHPPRLNWAGVDLILHDGEMDAHYTVKLASSLAEAV
ncbi:MAG: hypothetical protein QXX19_03765 [Candidatus Caldarchaeum sp.]